MFDIAAYKELGKEIKLLLEKAREAVAQEQYGALEQVLYQNEALLHRHELMVKSLESSMNNTKEMTSQDLDAINEMQLVLNDWNNETKRMTNILEQVKETTQKALIGIQQGKQILHTYHPQGKSPSRFVDKQQ